MMNNGKKLIMSLFAVCFMSAVGSTVFAMNENQVDQDDVRNRVSLITEQLNLNNRTMLFVTKTGKRRVLFRKFFLCSKMDFLDQSATDIVDAMERLISEALEYERNAFGNGNSNAQVEREQPQENPWSEIGVDGFNFESDMPDSVARQLEVYTEKMREKHLEAGRLNDQVPLFQVSVPALTSQQKKIRKQFRENQQKLIYINNMRQKYLREKEEERFLAEEQKRQKALQKQRVEHQMLLENNIQNTYDAINQQIKLLRTALEDYKNKQDKNKIKEKLQQSLLECEDILNTIQSCKIIARQGFTEHDKKNKKKFIIDDLLTRHGRKFPVPEMQVRSGVMVLKNFFASFWQKPLSENEYETLYKLHANSAQLIEDSLDLFQDIEDFLS